MNCRICSLAMVLLLGACASNDEKMQKVDPRGSAAQLNDLHDNARGIAKSPDDTDGSTTEDLNDVPEID